MKRLKLMIFAVVALITLRSSSCNKESLTHTSSGTWHVGNAAYTAKTVTKYATNIQGMAADNINYASVILNSIPGSAPDAGTNYKIVGYEKMGQLANDECIVQVVTTANDMYISNATNNATLNLKIDNDFVTITVPSIWATHYVSYSAQADSAKIDMNLAQ